MSEKVLKILRKQFGDDIIETHSHLGDDTAVIEPLPTQQEFATLLFSQREAIGHQALGRTRAQRVVARQLLKRVAQVRDHALVEGVVQLAAAQQEVHLLEQRVALREIVRVARVPGHELVVRQRVGREPVVADELLVEEIFVQLVDRN